MKIQGSESNPDELISTSETETFLLAKKLGESFKGKEVVLLIGELGAGKTVFAKGIAAGLGLEDVHQVCSPSFTLVNIYQAKVPVFHIDLYRLGKDSEIDDIGWEDYLERGVVIVEWGEKLHADIEAIKVTLEVQEDDTRKIKIEGI
jgi:tRNA threonylcarbamoyladenosine biosynthesis protein TsaE